MTTNFDYLKKEPQFSAFADVAISAEKIILLDPEASILNSRRAMEFALKWMYSVDEALEMPYQDNLQSLMNAEEYRQIIGQDLWKRMDYIRCSGNRVAHTNQKLGRDEAMLCLENLFIYLDFVAYCYSDKYEEHDFNKSIIKARIDRAKQSRRDEAAVKEKLVQKQDELAQKDLDLQTLMKENAALKTELSARRQEQQITYVPKPLDFSEFKTRKLYIDSMLAEAGWTEGKDWINEVEILGMPNKSGIGYADYILYDNTHRPLAIVEAKRTCVDVSKGRQQAKLYADSLEQKYKRRPIIFLTNGFETHIIDGWYPERKCAVIYSRRDLEKWFNLITMRTSLNYITVNKKIAGRYYQEAAIKAVCNSFGQKNRRKALLVMATGSGKTRTVIALCDVLLQAGWIKNILFLADRNSLVTQAKRNFVNLLPDLSCTNLVEEKDNCNAHCVLSTYQTMMNCIDTVNDREGRVFTCGHFDLVICDEAHRSIYNKYKDIFSYFDAPLVGLTATPKDEIDKNTYKLFELDEGIPTYGYDLAQAVKDGYLVDYISVESRLKFMEQGIVYDELSEADREAYEDTFKDEMEELPETIGPSALNTWIFNKDTIPSVDKGAHALNHDISVIFCVVLNQRTSKYASIVLLVNYRNIYGQGHRVGKKSIFVPARRLIDAYWTYAEGKQRNRGKNWLFSDRVSLCPLRVRQVLDILMMDGIKIDYGQKLGKTIIFAKNHDHAKKILEVFHEEYPHLPDFAEIIDNYMTYAQSAIDEFSDPRKMPQIAISVDMLDTGIDIPEILNLVFFKKVLSKSKFWQMIGRGTRLCPALLDGGDKKKFYIFDFCGNFEFFRMNKGKAVPNTMALQGAVFHLKFEISYKLQDVNYQVDRLIAYRNALVKQMSEKVRELSRDNFSVRQHLKYVDLYSSEANYQCLTFEDTLVVKEELAPLILPDGDEASAVRFDALLYGIELASLLGRKYTKARRDLINRVSGIAGVASIPEIQTDLIHKILDTDYIENAGIDEFEEIREKLRGLMKYIPKDIKKYETDFTDELLSVQWKEAALENDELKNYKAKAEYYIRQNKDHIAIAKLRSNQPLTGSDVKTLEEILWKEIGTKQDYEREIGEKPLGEFVREIVGLDMNAAKEAFSEYLTSTDLDSRQIYFVNQIAEYIVHNGMLKDLSILQEAPFTDRGSVAEVFSDLTVWRGIRKVIDRINANTVA